MSYDDELSFERDLIKLLFSKGWEETVLKNKTEEELLRNWADILFDNNRDKDRLNNYPLTDTEMQQILDQVRNLRTPLKLNGFINGKTVSIKRDNVEDKLHLGKEVSLKIYDRDEIAAGQSRYQIAEQLRFRTSEMTNDRRGDLMLLINGMPVIHIELKKSGVPVSKACYQIEKYAKEQIFTGIFSLVQVFVAMNPKETLYFANPGPDGKFNPDYYFHWADFNNEPINAWKDIASSLLSIPMAHQLIGFYTVADGTDGILKVMRSYQYYAASTIADRVTKKKGKWDDKNQRGGYIWHTTGSGKTMTSFKAAQLISNSKDADKVVFLVDRIELGTQSLAEYRNFADDSEDVQATENTNVLISKLKSNDPSDSLIVTSIQKMSNIKEEGGNDRDLEKINSKRLVFIVDECHRSTFGDMMCDIKNNFKKALFFGFTGTPIFDRNKKKNSMTVDVFGDQLHRYTIADGIRDKNVLGFDPYMVETFKEDELRNKIALEQAKAETFDEAMNDPKKKKIYFHFTNRNEVPMAGYFDDKENYHKGIEDYFGHEQYNQPKHRNAVVKDILDKWRRLSYDGKFHAIFATNSINEACEYYALFEKSGLKVTCMFDESIDNNEGATVKEKALVKILDDYNKIFKQSYTIPTYQRFKKDVASRLAHKKPYLNIENNKNEQLDLLIVVDQMLTGFDSKWINTLYLDKQLLNENIIQAFSRTNRLFGPEKPFGTIKYYRKPHTMKRNVDIAIKDYSGDRVPELFVSRLGENLTAINLNFGEIEELFESAGIKNFERLPDEQSERGKFAQQFKLLNLHLEAAKIQGFTWNELEYLCDDEERGKVEIKLALDEHIYNTLLQRYKELRSNTDGEHIEDVPYDIDTYITEIGTGTIDDDYMNSRFEKYIKSLNDGSPEEVRDKTLTELHKSFASLSQEEQKYANVFLHDIERGDVNIEAGKTLKDYITEYMVAAKNDQIYKFAISIGVDETMLREFMSLHVNEANINEYGRLDKLIESVDRSKAKEYFEKKTGEVIKPFRLNIHINKIVRKFILTGGFEI